MRKLRILIVVCSVIAIGFFAAYTYYEMQHTDDQAPVITADQDTIHVSVDATDEELLQGMKAIDNLDGDVTDSFVVVSRSKFVAAGTLKVNYAAFDKNNNVGLYSREVVYDDYVSPRFSQSAPLRFPAGESGIDYLTDITAEDCLDGNITSQIRITFGNAEIKSDTVKEQPLNIQVTNSAGDTAVLTLTARQEDYASYAGYAPSLSNYIYYMKAGEKPEDLKSLVNGVWSAGRIYDLETSGFNLNTDIIIDESKADYSTPGIYQVSFRLSNRAEGAVNRDLREALLTVIVEDEP